jgi:hypothetical protein
MGGELSRMATRIASSQHPEQELAEIFNQPEVGERCNSVSVV